MKSVGAEKKSAAGSCAVSEFMNTTSQKRGGRVRNVRRLLYHSTLSSRLMKKRQKQVCVLRYREVAVLYRLCHRSDSGCGFQSLGHTCKDHAGALGVVQGVQGVIGSGLLGSTDWGDGVPREQKMLKGHLPESYMSSSILVYEDRNIRCTCDS